MVNKVSYNDNNNTISKNPTNTAGKKYQKDRREKDQEHSNQKSHNPPKNPESKVIKYPASVPSKTKSSKRASDLTAIVLNRCNNTYLPTIRKLFRRDLCVWGSEVEVMLLC